MSKNRRIHNQSGDGSVLTNNVDENHSSQHRGSAFSPKQNGDCVLCKRSAVCVCQRCGDFYCSPDCQRRDWQAHRYICFPMPNLVRPTTYDYAAESNNVPVLSAPNSNCATFEKQQQESQKIQNVSQQSNKSLQNSTGGAVLGQHGNDKRQQYGAGHKTQQPCLHPLSSPVPKHNSRVLLAGFRSPNRCYVRSLAECDVDGFMRVSKMIDTYGKTAPRLTKVPHPNSYAISYLDPTGIMYRVQVLTEHAGSCRVLFLDNGATAVRQMSDLREINDSIIKLQQYTVQVQLKNVENYEMTHQLMNFLAQFEDKQFKLQCCKDDDGHGGNIILRHWQNDSSLNDEIVKFAAKMNVFSDNSNMKKSDASTIGSGKSNGNFSTRNESYYAERNQTQNNRQQQQGRNNDKNAKAPVKEDVQKSSLPPVTTTPLEMRYLTAGEEDVEVIVVDNSCLNLGFFACITRSDVKNFAAIQEYLSKFEDTKLAYKPRLNEYCIAKFEGDWYRAKVTAIPSDNRFNVLYIDYTNEATIDSADIRLYPSNFTNACTTNMCLVDGLPSDINKKLQDYLQAQIPMNSFVKIGKVKSVDEQIVIVELNWLNKKLLDEKLL